EERSPSPFPSPPGRGDSFGNGRFFGATLGREAAPGYKREALLPSAQWISKPTPSPFPNGFPSPPRVSFPRRDVRFAKRGPPWGRGDSFGNDRFFGATLDRESAPGIRKREPAIC